MSYDGDCVYAQERAAAIARAIEKAEMADICVCGRGSLCRCGRSQKSFNDIQEPFYSKLDGDGYEGFNGY